MKNRTPINIVLALIFLSFSLHINGQVSKRIDSLAKAYAIKGFNGNVLYSKNDTILFTGNYGYRDFSRKQLLNDDTIFELGSCSKQITAVAIVQLVEKNLINYETRVNEIIENFPYNNITIEHLLRHQSGLPDYQDIFYKKKNWNRNSMATNLDLLNVLSKLKLDLEFKPGTKYKYSNTGYAILASIIEKISGQSYGQYLTGEIFKPAEMTSSKVYSIEEKIENSQNAALGHTYNNRKNKYQIAGDDKNHKYINWMNDIIGSRGVYASILDLEKWKKAFRYNLLITKESKRRIVSVDDISKKYGYGFAIYNSEDKGKWVYHNGSWAGYKTTALYLPDSNEYLLILSNNRYEETYKKFEEDFYNLLKP